MTLDDFSDNTSATPKDAGNNINQLVSLGGSAANSSYIGRGLGNFKRTSENILQTAFGVLAEAVQNHMDSMRSTNPRIYWRDIHTTNIKRDDGACRKPDGSFLTTSDSSPEWRNIVAAVEIKGGDMSSDHHHLCGQILQNFIDMADFQPRRRLGKDCGYLTKHNSGLPGEFSLANIMGIEHVESKLPLQTTVHLDYADENSKEFGRHGHLNGQRTWVYSAQYWNDEHSNGHISDAFFKFQRGFDDEVEIEVHRHVLHKKSVKSIFKDGGLCVSNATLIDIFAGYVHTLLAAAAVAKNKFALHRDISAGSLMVKNNHFLERLPQKLFVLLLKAFTSTYSQEKHPSTYLALLIIMIRE
ncbi:hypothetical protein IWW48_003769 [Coemansia sp. RSA 1200]|nr:hypothetical protein IWW48_003769 [Coemansia sp. RSA 1200]